MKISKKKNLITRNGFDFFLIIFRNLKFSSQSALDSLLCYEFDFVSKVLSLFATKWRTNLPNICFSVHCSPFLFFTEHGLGNRRKNQPEPGKPGGVLICLHHYLRMVRT